ncbi:MULTISPECIES: oxidoreductase family protein [unclassified Oceanispirochaeta]|uniref:oxidoreductase family protein n=1 Tax=unclassified Oceanispirochaeta TaxID=2635722 RepID=UPI000E09AA0F|nr:MULTISPECIES: oxidoreductase family protein [unclassified Oceanispirochaeta]MBF9015891.1 DUF1679 domain-containing protein [Oceanispirochaeta sp. M2]NPD72354.1 DUF1679 domain-containing protein [Oceanispirochaeta sp. M1]RDG32125.1 DUF1679 domain-containing protein [Oceanispirochaeta sp. M1]
MSVKEIILKSTGAGSAREIETIQKLWSGYGSIIRYELDGGTGTDVPLTVIVKHVRFREAAAGGHPGGWDTDLSHQRKLHSYQVETRWYGDWSSRCDEFCRVPVCYALESREDDVVMVLEDLDAAGFPERRQSVDNDDIHACLSWLAYFHARFMDETPEGLWECGTYWHLETRPQELAVLGDRKLKEAAPLIDRKLKAARYQTFVHGDAKLANFCFPRGKVSRAAAVDFQYVGGGSGMKDLAYFIGSCFYEEECEAKESELLDSYFEYMRQALLHYGKNIDAAKVEEEGRALFPWAWTDFHRFLKGWSPGHWKLNSYSERAAQKILESL